MSDIVERLRVEADLYEQCGDTKITRHYRAAANEIERLRAALWYYIDNFCEYSACYKGCGKLSDDVCAGCKARAALSPAPSKGGDDE